MLPYAYRRWDNTVGSTRGVHRLGDDVAAQAALREDVKRCSYWVADGAAVSLSSG